MKAVSLFLAVSVWSTLSLAQGSQLKFTFKPDSAISQELQESLGDFLIERCMSLQAISASETIAGYEIGSSVREEVIDQYAKDRFYYLSLAVLLEPKGAPSLIEVEGDQFGWHTVVQSSGLCH
jgi:hypothetical protein